MTRACLLFSQNMFSAHSYLLVAALIEFKIALANIFRAVEGFTYGWNVSLFRRFFRPPPPPPIAKAALANPPPVPVNVGSTGSVGAVGYVGGIVVVVAQPIFKYNSVSIVLKSQTIGNVFKAMNLPLVPPNEK